MNRYTASKLSNTLQNLGYSVSVRKIQYYAYEKNMFPHLKAGKEAFSDRELEDVIKIQKLQKCTSLKLDEIKEIIKDKSIDDIDKYITGTYYSTFIPNLDSIDSCKRNLNSQSNYLNAFQANSFSSSNNGVCLSDYNNKSNLNSLDKYGLTNNVSKYSLEACANNTSIKEEKIQNTENRVISVNKDITLTVSSNIDNEKLKKIINFINQL